MLSRETFRHRPSSRQLLDRVLATPDLATHIRSLSGANLARLLDQVGLEDAGELVALATTEQLAQVFDRDLWRSERAGEDERFDSARFVLWLQIMLEAGEAFVVERLLELPQDLVTLALHRHVLVVPLAELEHELNAGDDDADMAEKALASSLSEELDDYQLIWRGGEGWDEVLAVLLALDREQHSWLLDLLERCAALGAEQLEDSGGLFALLSSEQMLEEDLAAEREARRAAEGYVAPSAAKAFLRLAREKPDTVPFTEHDVLTRAYFRDLAPTSAQPARAAVGYGRLLTGKSSTPAPEPLLILALAELRQDDPALFATRSEELAYLVNVLIAGYDAAGQRLRPYEAVQLAVATVSDGLRAAGADSLRRYPCDGLFRLAWSSSRAAAAANSEHAR